MGSDKWILYRNNENVGPLTLDQLRHIFRTGQVDGNANVRRAEDENWIRLSQVPGLQQLPVRTVSNVESDAPSRNPNTPYIIAAVCGLVVWLALWAIDIVNKPSPTVRTAGVSPMLNTVEVPVYDTTLPDGEKWLFNVPAVNVLIVVNDAISRHVSKDKVKNKAELILRRNNIKVDPNAGFLITIKFVGLVTSDVTTAYSYETRVEEAGVVGSQNDSRGLGKVLVTTWSNKGIGFVGSNEIESQIIKLTEEMTEKVTNKLLAAKP
jgi:hypothetical protein